LCCVNLNQPFLCRALSQAKSGDVVIPLAIVPDGSLSDAPRILHPYVVEAKRKAVTVAPLFTGATVDQIGTVLVAVARKKGAHALVLGRAGPDSSLTLGEYVLRHSTSPTVVAYVRQSDALQFDDGVHEVVSKDLQWSDLDLPDYSPPTSGRKVFESSSLKTKV
jgi:hypothetical protein